MTRPRPGLLSYWRRVAKEYGVPCVYCRNAMAAMTADHYVPLSKGGPNDMLNLVPACRACQQTKADKMPDEALSPAQQHRAQEFFAYLRGRGINGGVPGPLRGKKARLESRAARLRNVKETKPPPMRVPLGEVARIKERR